MFTTPTNLGSQDSQSGGSEATSVYLRQVWNVLPRLLALYDQDNTSPTFGVGDRCFWAWKLIDFPNGTFQGAAHGLARLLTRDLLPPWFSHTAVFERIDAMFEGADRVRRSNGSMEEAFPYESSYCVTALVAFDLLSAVDLLSDELDRTARSRYLRIVEPMIRFVGRSRETHAFISNHLATAAAALLKWSALAADKQAELKAKAILGIILQQQSTEGWFREYEGADPGYQTLATYYLADMHLARPELGLLEPLRRSTQFLWHFAHPDGSFGGIYGSRNTRFWVPAGIEALSDEVSEARSLARRMRSSVEEHRTVTLDAMDAPNLVPIFNAYCWAAAMIADQATEDRDGGSELVLPAHRREDCRVHFQQAGLIVDNGPEHYSIVSWHKGGVCYHFTKSDGRCVIDAGVVARASHGRLYSTQAYDTNNLMRFDGDAVIVTSRLTAVHDQLPTPLRFICLRLANLSLMRIHIVNEWIKRLLVKYLITGRKRLPAHNDRTIHLGPRIQISDSLDAAAAALRKLNIRGPFSTIHMASQGYWQRQDDAA